MLKSPRMFEDECLFYTLANFYREQSNLKGIFYRVEVFVSAGFGTGVGQLYLALPTPHKKTPITEESPCHIWCIWPYLSLAVAVCYTVSNVCIYSKAMDKTRDCMNTAKFCPKPV